MKTTYLQFNYHTIYCVFAVLIVMLVYAIAAKLFHDYMDKTFHTLLAQYTLEIKTLFFPPNHECEILPFSKRLDAYYEQNKNLMKKRHFRFAFEDALLDVIVNNEEANDMGRETAHRFSYVKDAIADLKSSNIARQMHGCQQVGTYLYEPAIPLLFQLLQTMSSKLQYNILMCLSEFGQPELIVAAFEIIEKAVLVNDRAVRKIVAKMGPRKEELFEAIFKTHSTTLIPLFLKFIDKDSANTYLDRIMFMVRSKDTELRIAVIRALSQTKNKKIVPDLIYALDAEEWEVRAAAAKGLESVPVHRAEAPLLRAMCDSSWWVRQNAASAALAMPNNEFMIRQALLTKDAYAIDSLLNAADLKGMSDIVDAIQAELQEDSTFQTDNNDSKTEVAIA